MKTTLTEDQKKQRLGLFSGSEVHKLMGVRGLGQTGETYIYEKVSEFLTGEPAKPEFSAASTQWGINYEDEAKEYFKAATGLQIDETGTLMNDFMCGTPDGVIQLENCGFEIKCPYNSGNHVKNFVMQNADDLLKLHKEYYWQCVSYMWLTGLNKWKFCSYDPRFKDKKMFILNIDLNEKHLNMLKERLQESKLIFDNIISKMK